MRTRKSDSIAASALSARTSFRKVLRQVEGERRSLVIKKRGRPTAVRLSIRHYVKLAAPEPEVLRVIGEQSQRKGTDRLRSRQIERIIEAARAQKAKRG